MAALRVRLFVLARSVHTGRIPRQKTARPLQGRAALRPVRAGKRRQAMHKRGMPKRASMYQNRADLANAARHRKAKETEHRLQAEPHGQKGAHAGREKRLSWPDRALFPAAVKGDHGKNFHGRQGLAAIPPFPQARGLSGRSRKKALTSSPCCLCPSCRPIPRPGHMSPPFPRPEKIFRAVITG